MGSMYGSRVSMSAIVQQSLPEAQKKNTEIQIHHIRFVILLLDHVLEIETILASPVKFFSRFFKDSFRCPIVSYFQLYLLKWRLCEGMSMQVYRY